MVMNNRHHCPNCGQSEIPFKKDICPKCGEQISEIQYVKDVKQYLWSNYGHVRMGIEKVYDVISEHEYEESDC